jgi:hypothetical protein
VVDTLIVVELIVAGLKVDVDIVEKLAVFPNRLV